MKPWLRILVLFLLDWVVLFLLYAMVNDWLSSTLDYYYAHVDYIVVSLDLLLPFILAVVLNKIFKITSKKHFLISQGLYLISLAVFIYIALRGIGSGFGRML